MEEILLHVALNTLAGKNCFEKEKRKEKEKNTCREAKRVL
jgi:hypothetical protein